MVCNAWNFHWKAAPFQAIAKERPASAGRQERRCCCASCASAQEQPQLARLGRVSVDRHAGAYMRRHTGGQDTQSMQVREASMQRLLRQATGVIARGTSFRQGSCCEAAGTI
jgi:hypothetical protein